MSQRIFLNIVVINDRDTAVEIILCGRTLGEGIFIAFIRALGVDILELMTILENLLGLIHTAVNTVVKSQSGRTAVIGHNDIIDAIFFIYQMSLEAAPCYL